MTIEIIHPAPGSGGRTAFLLEGLDPAGGYIATVRDANGRRVHWTALRPFKGGPERRLRLAGPLKGKPAGTYEVQVYADADFDQRTGEPMAGADPVATKPFAFLGAQQQAPPAPSKPPQVVRLSRSAAQPTDDEVLSTLVLVATEARSFVNYKAHVDAVVCRSSSGGLPSNAYELLHSETMTFLEQVKGPFLGQGGTLTRYLTNGLLPYVDQIAQRYQDLISGDPCSDLSTDLLTEPFPIELIFSYWQEEGGLVQTLNHILARFQNRRVGPGQDALARFDLSPLRPLRKVMWQWAEQEVGRLTVRRRAAEYEFEYGLPLVGRAVPSTRLYVERRSRFLEAFHTLVHEAHVFFTLDDDTTVNADAFPVYNALRDVHLVLAEGASNQFGDLPTQARAEMLEMQWLLAQPEMRDFLGGKPMIPYEEPWMDRVDTVRALLGWTPASVSHFHDLAVHGEQLLLTIRWNNWNNTSVGGANALNWARTWRNAIQRYAHAYRAVTGVDLTASADPRPPGLLLARRLPAAARRVSTR